MNRRLGSMDSRGGTRLGAFALAGLLVIACALTIELALDPRISPSGVPILLIALGEGAVLGALFGYLHRARARGARDQAERAQRAERRLQVQYAVTRVLGEAGSLGEATPRIIAAVCESLGWEVGAIWVLPRGLDVLHCLEVWHAPSLAAPQFEADTRQRTFSLGVGLPGRVWSLGEPVWIQDVVSDPNFPRASVASREGLHGAFGFPVRLGEQILGVLEFFSCEIRAPDADLLSQMGAIGSQIGQFIERKQAEEDAGRLLDRERVARAAAERAERQAAFLAEASRVLAASLDYETTLASAARLAVPQIADWCVVHTIGVDGAARCLVVEHSEPARTAAAWEMVRRYPFDPEARTGPAEVMRTGRAELVPEIPEMGQALRPEEASHLAELRRLGFTSFMCVPLRARGHTFGTISFIAGGPDRKYGPTDLAVAEELAHRAALAADSARLYGQAREASRAKDEFLARVSHDLRAPLSATLLWLHMLRGGKLDAEATASALEKIEKGTELQVKLIEDLLDVSRIITGKLRLNLCTVELETVIKAALEGVRPAADGKRIRLDVELDASVGPVSGDPDRLLQVLWNLLCNAIAFTPEGGRVGVRLDRAGPHARIAVRDTGVGIDPGFLPRIFERFTQADATRSHGGLGLGLAIVHHLVELHGGTVRAESEGKGRGATFTVTLPIPAVRVSEPAPGTASTAERPLAGLHVLVVDDDPGAREVLGEVLVGCRAQVTAVASVAEALATIDRSRPDVILSDIQLPDEDGYVLIEKLRSAESRRSGRIPAMALTGCAGADDRARALRAGFEVCLAKPIGPDELVAAVARVAGRSPVVASRMA